MDKEFPHDECHSCKYLVKTYSGLFCGWMMTTTSKDPPGHCPEAEFIKSRLTPQDKKGG